MICEMFFAPKCHQKKEEDEENRFSNKCNKESNLKSTTSPTQNDKEEALKI